MDHWLSVSSQLISSCIINQAFIIQLMLTIGLKMVKRSLIGKKLTILCFWLGGERKMKKSIGKFRILGELDGEKRDLYFIFKFVILFSSELEEALMKAMLKA